MRTIHTKLPVNIIPVFLYIKDEIKEGTFLSLFMNQIKSVIYHYFDDENPNTINMDIEGSDTYGRYQYIVNLECESNEKTTEFRRFQRIENQDDGCGCSIM